jgi:hypothetical protein
MHSHASNIATATLMKKRLISMVKKILARKDQFLINEMHVLLYA